MFSSIQPLLKKTTKKQDANAQPEQNKHIPNAVTEPSIFLFFLCRKENTDKQVISITTVHPLSARRAAHSLAPPFTKSSTKPEPD